MVSPYGSWQSPITVEMMTAASVGLEAPAIDDSGLYWLQSCSAEGGRCSLWHADAGVEGAKTELTPSPFYVRSTVHEYGGGAYSVSDGTVVFCNHGDHRVYRIDDGQPPVAITPDQPAHRFGDLRVHPGLDLVLSIREDHTIDDAEPMNTLVALELQGPNQTGGVVLRSGPDFISTPELGTDEQLAWVEWDHPDMPWDASRVMTGRLDLDQLEIGTPRRLAGGGQESATQPRWLGPQQLIFATDRTNWWNLYRCDLDQADAITALHPMESAFASPQWSLGMQPYAVVNDDLLLCRWLENGLARLGTLQVSDGRLTEIDTSACVVTSISSHGNQAVVLLGYPDRAPALTLLDLTRSGRERAGAQLTEIRRASEVELPPELISRAQPVSWDSDHGTVYGWFYKPANPQFDPPAGTLPPLITMSHGGPTGYSGPDLRISYQYWTSRGFAILDVNYSGSTGYGRAYRERLKGNWGVVDVADCIAGAQAMADRGLADPDRLAIQGGSAGGYTTLRALTSSDVFDAGVSMYGIGDLTALARDTHKFESHYLDGLVGPYPEAQALYADRSPINQVEQLGCPMLILQGLEDKVVPPSQANSMREAVLAKGLPVACVMFEGEGHGFRKAETIKASIRAQLFFYSKVFGFTPAEDLPVVEIENLEPTG